MTDTPMGAPAGGEGTPPQPQDPETHEGIRFKDNRRIDPRTFEPRVSAPEPAVDPVPEVLDDAAVKIDELTADLQRLSAEYANYRRRVDRDRQLQHDLAVAAVLTDLLPVLDDIGRARDHGELDGGFKAVAEAVESVTGRHGLVAYGTIGEAFDPNVHEAMTSHTAPDVTGPTVTNVYQVGYRLKDRVLRAARVAVTDNE